MPNRTLVLESLVGTPVTIFFQDLNGDYQWFVNPQSVWAEWDRTGTNECLLFHDNDRQKLAKAKQLASETGEARSVDVTAFADDESGRPAHWNLHFTINRKRDQETGADGYICSCIDVTDQKQREQTLKNLLREVAHRSKNMLAMVLSLSSQTARVAPTKTEYIRRFTGRLQSLAKSQDVITESDWRGSTLSDLVRRQVRDVVPLADGKITFEGDNIELGPNGTLHIGLALHELVTNALVHGALSLADSVITISCHREPGPDANATLIWRETPRVHSSVDKQQSFGRTMLERIVPAAINGEGSLELSNDAVVYTLSIGHSEII
ncbi:PAS domain-containing sensor histidine kinase [Oricola indica]|jgi:two-component sensor histidine kinase|uniref:PAS domain-containing sensor histidine kinase n=1 Tax=Oricola indica TaxID=2872591 RepID=UPI001CBFBBB2|nr:sensor histidine kinase [Oricola indica]